MPLTDTRKLCLHTITTKPWPIEEAIDQYSRVGVKGMTVWRQALEGRNPAAVGRHIRETGLTIVSLCRGGFFPAPDQAGRQVAIEDNLKAIDEAAELGAPLIVLVCGAIPGQPLEVSRRQIHEGIAAVLPHAQACGVRLAIEPLHPMYADNRSAINSLQQANDACQALASPGVGVALDVYHVWWEPNLAAEIQRCGQAGWLFAFHVCDWKTPTEDLLNDRGLMGEGCIPIPTIRGWVEQAGFAGFNEVEIFSTKYWAEDQLTFLEKIKAAYLEHV
ncbi:MAG TPA: sugar phosphate isomerase/epimerase family protein [Anaerolineae bacterium]|nr:sugar phosphate isomerase/epimerase family protein [Anaerolineae bacterium]HMR64177.1 sugar phosphate isomerase/epimerase family protein [Anaerolineae bacterium]